MDRREFLAKAGLLATWALIPVTITSCGGDDDGSPSNPDGGGNNGDVQANVGVAAGHTHAATITRAQITAGNAVTLLLTGGDHTHSVTLTADEVMAIGGGQRISKQSTSERAHTHTVTFN